MKKILMAITLVLTAPCVLFAKGRSVSGLTFTCLKHEEMRTFSDLGCWVMEDMKGPAAVYVVLERPLEWAIDCYRPLMRAGKIPPGMIVSLFPGTNKSEDGKYSRYMRAEEFDSVGPSFPSAIIEEIVPFCAKKLGVEVDPSPERWAIMGASSGGIAAFNACWYRNDKFRRCYANSPTFSNIRSGNTLMPLVRKSETRPIRVWISVGTDEPDYYFGDSYYVAIDAVSALRYAGYNVRFDRFLNEGHAARFASKEYNQKVMSWLFQGWKNKEVSVATNPIRVRDLIKKGEGWQVCEYKMPPPVRETVSVDAWRTISVNPTNRFVMTSRILEGGARDQTYRLAPLELAWNVSRPGGFALAQLEDGRILVATELGVQGIIPFGVTDVVLPLPGDLPCDNVTVVGNILYASSGERVFKRTLQKNAASPGKKSAVSCPLYDDGFWYSRHHEPAADITEMLGSYVTAGRIAGVVSILSDPDYNTRVDCVGWANYGFNGEKRRPMTIDTMFAIFSMTKTFTGAAIMCAIDDGKMSLDDEVARYLPEFADVKMKDGSKPKRPLTIRDMMSHMTGFRSGLAGVNRTVSLREVARALAKERLVYQPGETFSYGNAWFCTAAACLEVATGRKFEDYLKEKIFDPLGMKDTTFWPNEEQITRLVSAYNSDDTKIRPAADRFVKHITFPKEGRICPAASGGLFSTPADMIRFSQMLAHHGEWKGKTIISRKTFDGIFAVRQTPPHVKEAYTVGSWLHKGDWFGHEGAMRTDQRANLKTGHARVFFIQTENAAGSAFFQIKDDWYYEADKIQLKK